MIDATYIAKDDATNYKGADSYRHGKTEVSCSLNFLDCITRKRI
jgi:hypothetical protein